MTSNAPNVPVDRDRGDDSSGNIAASQSLVIAREIDRQKNIWIQQLRDGVTMDADALETMVGLRQSLAKTVPANPFDAMLIVASAQCVSAFMFYLSHSEKKLGRELTESIQNGALEIWTALDSVRVFLETECGTSVKDLGVFQDEVTLQ